MTFAHKDLQQLVASVYGEVSRGRGDRLPGAELAVNAVDDRWSKASIRVWYRQKASGALDVLAGAPCGATVGGLTPSG